MILVMLFAGVLTAQTKTEDPFKVKSTYIISFIKYLEWDNKDILPENDSPIIIGILADENEDTEKYLDLFNQFAEIINNKPTMQERLTKNHKLEIKHFTSLAEVIPCHILFITSQKLLTNSDASKQEDVLRPLQEKLNGYPTLLVGDFENFAQKMGGHVNFTLNQGRVEFIINLDAVKKSGIQVRASLLQAAQKG